MVPVLERPYVVWCGRSSWLEVALFAPAHPPITIAAEASAVAARMQENEQLKTTPLTGDPIDLSAI